MRRTLLLLLFGLSGGTIDAMAAWDLSGVPVCGYFCGGSAPFVVSDGAGGVFIAWTDGANAPVTDDDVYLQHLTSSGDVAPGWPARGLAVCVLQNSQRCESLAPDGSGGALLVWYDRRIGTQDLYAQRVMDDGSLAPGWQPSGTPVSLGPRYPFRSKIAPDSTGGAWLVWEDYVGNPGHLYAQHLLANGSVAPDWPPDGRSLLTDSTEVGSLGLVSDGSSGFFVSWAQASAPPLPQYPADAYALRVTGDGDPAPGWPAMGRRVFDDFLPTGIVSDMTGGIYVAARAFFPGTSDEKDFRVQRLTPDGLLAPGWPAEGLLVATGTRSRQDLNAASDGAGGVLLAWSDSRAPAGADVYASRLLPGAVLAPGWPVNGLRVGDPNERNDFDISITLDQIGGLYLAWEQQRDFGTPGRIQHVTSAAQFAVGWPDSGFRASTTAVGQFKPRLAPDGSGGAIVVWDEAGGCCDRIGLFAQRFVTDGVVAAQISLASSEATPERVTLLWSGAGAGQLAASVERRTAGTNWETLGAAEADGPDRLRFEDHAVVPGARYAYRIRYREDGVWRVTSEAWVEVPRTLVLSLEGFQPNPATGAPSVAFTLPRAAGASLELLDVSGRRVAARELTALGAGRHVIRLDGLSVPPGMYWICLRHGEQQLVRRGVVAR